VLEKSLMNSLSTSLYSDGTGSSGKEVGGLQLIVADAGTGTVGGINSSTYTFWQNAQTTATSSAFSVANVQTDMNTIYLSLVRGADSPDLVMAGTNAYTAFLGSLQAIQRIANENGEGEFGTLGYQTLKYNTADVVLDGGFQGFSTDPFPGEVSTTVTGLGGAPASTMYFLNTKYIHWRPHSRRNMVPLDPDRFSVNQDAMVKLMGWAGNMTLSNAFLQGVLNNT